MAIRGPLRGARSPSPKRPRRRAVSALTTGEVPCLDPASSTDPGCPPVGDLRRVERRGGATVLTPRPGRGQRYARPGVVLCSHSIVSWAWSRPDRVGFGHGVPPFRLTRSIVRPNHVAGPRSRTRFGRPPSGPSATFRLARKRTRSPSWGAADPAILPARSSVRTPAGTAAFPERVGTRKG